MFFACKKHEKIEFHDTPGFIELRVNAKSLLFANNAKKRRKNKKFWKMRSIFQKFFVFSEKFKKDAQTG